METNNLPKIVMGLIMVGLLLAVGMLMYAKMNRAISTKTDVTLENVTIASGVGYLARVDQGIYDIDAFVNHSYVTAKFNLTTANWTTSGYLMVGVNDGNYLVNYTYYRNDSAASTFQAGIDALSPISSDWLPLLITVIVLAVIIGIVLSSFSRYTNR